MIADKDYYADSEGNLVAETDPKAAFMVAAKGTEIPAHIADKYKIKAKGEAKTEPTKPETEAKGKAAPAENKSKTPKENK